MLSNYFKTKVKTNYFKDNLRIILNEVKNKKVIIYGAGSSFEEINKLYNLTKNINVVAIADKQFENSLNRNIDKLKLISPKNIKDEEFDEILVTNEYYEPVIEYLQKTLKINSDNIKILLKQESKDERANIKYLYDLKFDKNLPKLIKKIKNKKVVFYGAGEYLELITKFFDLSDIDVIAVSDRKFQNTTEQEFLGYKTCAPENIKTLHPDYVIITTKYYTKIYEYLYKELLKGTKIKILPLIDKPFLMLLKEIWQY